MTTLFDCTICGSRLDDTLIRFARPGMALKCQTCRDKEHEQEVFKIHEAEELTRLNFRNDLYSRLEFLLTECGAPKRNSKNTLANFDGQKPVNRPGCIVGPTGAGKTHLAIGYLKQYIAEKFDAQITTNATAREQSDMLEKILEGVHFYSALDFVWTMRKTDDAHAAMNTACSFEFLVLDDFGAERPTDWAVECIGKLIYTRHANVKDTLVTSNLNIKDMAAAFNERIASRIAEFGDVLSVQGRNRRLNP
jgi:DNA replication protein DnaC